MTELISLKQVGSVDEYTTEFQALQYDVTMQTGIHDELFFATHYILGLKEEIRVVVEPQVPKSVDTAAVIVRIQQKLVDRGKMKYHKNMGQNKPPQVQKPDTKPNQQGNLNWRDRQLRDYRKANACVIAMGTNMNQAIMRYVLKE